MSRQLNDVATFSLLQRMSRPLNDVATSLPCKLMSRQLLIWQLMSRQLNDVATLISLQADVATASDSVLTSRPLLDVATSTFSFLKILCRDFYLVPRPPCLLFCIQFLSRPYVVLPHCHCIATTDPFFLVYITYCNIIQLVI